MKTVLVSLRSDGGLQLQLSARDGTRPVPFNDLSTLQRVLHSEHSAIGEAGAPTIHQVRHWEEHVDRFDSRCPFCRYFAQGKTITKPSKQIKLEDLDLDT